LLKTCYEGLTELLKKVTFPKEKRVGIRLMVRQFLKPQIKAVEVLETKRHRVPPPNHGLEPTGLISALFDCPTRLGVLGWRRLFPAPARRLNPDR